MFIVMLDVWADGDIFKTMVGDMFACYDDAHAAARAAVTITDGPWGWAGIDGWVALVTPEGITAV